jgi:Insertion element 4 transposase N-terminal/Transposase DDE domain
LPSKSDTVVLPRAITVAAGLYAPGHLGELTRYVPFELVDAVLAEAGAVQRRLRVLPSRVGVYLVLAMGLFEQCGLVGVWNRLVAGLGGLQIPSVSEKALRDLRRRIGPGPIKALFGVLAGPLAQPHTPGVRYRHWRTVAFDGCASLKIPDHERNRAAYGKIRYRPGLAGYPVLALMALVETGTRGVLGAVFGPASTGERAYATRLLPLLGPDMLVLHDRGFDSDQFLAAVAGTGAQFLVRAKATRRLVVGTLLPDGSYLTRIGALQVRVIEARVTLSGADGRVTSGTYRLITTLLEHRADPAQHLVALYHERWEIESAFYALRHSLLRGRVLRSKDPVGIEQEMWALLTLYQVLRTVMLTAAESVAGTDPDRACFTVALQAARDTLIAARGVVSDTLEPVGEIGRAVLAVLLPPRRRRYSARKVKSPISRYHAPDPARPPTSTRITAMTTTIRPPDTTDQPKGRWPAVLAVLDTDPARPCTVQQIADAIGHTGSLKGFHSQMMYWSKRGLLCKTAPSTYVLPRDRTEP